MCDYYVLSMSITKAMLLDSYSAIVRNRNQAVGGKVDLIPNEEND